MATSHAQNLNLNDSVLKLQTIVNNFVTIRKSSAPDIERNIQSILSWVEDEKAKAAKQSGNVSKITKVGNVIETCAESLKSVISGNAVLVMKGCLRIHLWLLWLVDLTELLPQPFAAYLHQFSLPALRKSPIW